MPIPITHLMERLHSAYIRAAVSHAQHNFTGTETDYGIDGTITRVLEIPYVDEEGKPKHKYITGADTIIYQLKATTKCERYENGDVKYRLTADALERFYPHINSPIPAVLIVYDMPDDLTKCVMQDEDQLLLMGCCYWKFMDEEALKTGVQRIPSSQIFNADAINCILDRHKQARDQWKGFSNASP